MKTILFQGDSITDASRNKEMGNDCGKGYAQFIKSTLGFEFPGKYTFLNRGINGNRSVDLYARIKSDIINLKPDMMSILIGVNDVWKEFSGQEGVDAEKYFKIYSMLIEEIQSALPNVEIMILEPFVLPGTATVANWEGFHSEVYKRAEKSRAIAEQYNLVFVPLQEKFDEAVKLCPAEYWLLDGVHPTPAGHELIKREWLKAFEKMQ
ncbi:MAG: SGNH/GDSL hydrolase family protein [Lachnospiraceae bacterium]|nr:SGNH/GDSL hydrolase family protein [Lachnospiraceae bacterium]